LSIYVNFNLAFINAVPPPPPSHSFVDSATPYGLEITIGASKRKILQQLATIGSRCS
jgi:hypothetical protein